MSARAQARDPRIFKLAAPKLPLLPPERAALRRARIGLRDTAWTPPETLARETGIALDRCRMLSALARFQSLGSVGPSLAADIWALGYRTFDDLAEADPSEMYMAITARVGHPVDPCVEDVFRCAVAQVRDPGLPDEARNWWYWMPYRGTSVAALPNDGTPARL